MKWSVRGACAALAACLLLACALGAAAAGLRCLALGAGLRGEPIRLGAAAGAFYSGLLLAAGLALLGAALLCRAPRGAPPAGPGPGPGRGAPGAPGGAARPARGRNLLLLGALVFMLGVLSAFAGAVIDGDAAALAARKLSLHCLPPRARPAPARASRAQCGRLQDYRRGLLLSAAFNALECLLGLLCLLLARSCRAARARGGRRRRGRGRGRARLRGPGPGARARRGRRGRRPGRLQPRPSEASILPPEESDAAAPGDCHAVAYISVGGAGARGAAGAEVSCAGHPSLELPGYAPSDPDLDASYPYCCRPRGAGARPWALGPAR